MAEKTRQFTISDTIPDIEDQDLRATLDEYLTEENKKKPGIWNFTTISGLAMVFVATSLIVQNIVGSLFGITLGPDLTGIVNILPVIGGALLVMMGLGFMASGRREKKKEKEKTPASYQQVSSGTSTSGYSNYSSGTDRLDDFLYSDQEKKKSQGQSSSQGLDSYALQQSKKLFKSRNDKKIAGVCGGLAKYFGTSATMVRLVFVLAALLGYGSFVLVYLAMMVIIPKEPLF